MTYGTYCWPIKRQHIHKMDVAEMKKLKLMCGKPRKNKIRYECFREYLEVASIEDKIIEIHFR